MAAKLSYRPKSKVLYRDRLCVITRVVSASQVLIEDSGTGDTLCKGRMKFPQIGRAKNPQMVCRLTDWCLGRRASLSGAVHDGVAVVVEC
ncbi:MAG TPA: hypothetical protein VEB64_02235, partial [Azospirillaceae bacterium]|nr:hypothetical protein [Azospirillaceae bacterium]